MANPNSKIPQWMNFLLEGDVYEANRTCHKHVRRHENIFCSVCLTFECEKCWKDSKKHEAHRPSHLRLYEVRRGRSVRSAIHYDDMKKLNWGKGPRIELGWTHHNSVVCLNPDEEDVHTEEPYDGKASRCVTCRNHVSKFFGFCSVLCKKKMIEQNEAKKAAERARIHEKC